MLDKSLLAKSESIILRLREQGGTLSCCESATGGLLSSYLTEIPGASSVFTCGLVTYTINSKSSLLGIEESLIESKGVVSEQVAILMARNTRNLTNTDIAVSITGCAGPSRHGDSEIGDAYIAVSTSVTEYSRFIHSESNTRHKIRLDFVNYLLDEISVLVF